MKNHAVFGQHMSQCGKPVALVLCAIAVFVAFSGIAAASQAAPELFSEMLSGPIWTVIYEAASVHPDSAHPGAFVEGTPVRANLRLFDSAGWLIQDIAYSVDGSASVKSITSVDGQGIPVSVLHYSGKNALMARESIQRSAADDGGLSFVRTVWAVDGTLTSTTVVRCDRSGREISREVRTADGVVAVTMLNEYDPNGRLRSRKEYGPAGALTTDTEWDYDQSNGLLVSEMRKGPEGEFTSTFELDLDGNWIVKRTSRMIRLQDGSVVLEPNEIIYRSITTHG
ncbi:MAG: hypothetical protein VB144_09885 [Clostridia bacterium]|nr:hypothetical protein [Clostridia bacterium]